MAPSDVLGILNDHIRRKYADSLCQVPWRNLPEIPTKEELTPPKDTSKGRDEWEEWDAYQHDPVYPGKPDLPKNIVDGPWPSTLEYLGAHYQILREDAIAPLRTSIQEYRANPQMQESKGTYVYTNVHIKGFQLSPIGPAFRVTFSTDRAGKRIRWEQSKRLTQGSMVALSTETEGFGTECKVAIVAARPVVGGLDQDPPSIDLFWGDLGDLVFDPAERFIMIEAQTSYFEASRHMLVALQKVSHEKFSLANHIVALDKDIGPPQYIVNKPHLNLSGLVRPEIDPITGRLSYPTEEPALHKVNVLEGIPDIPGSGMDESQMNACTRMLTNRLAIVQGPPGTGKTFTSVSAIKTLLENLDHDDPPIIIAAQTNHALDQLMNHIMAFEPSVVRLGGRCAKENIEILKRTIYELRQVHGREVKGGSHGMKFYKTALGLKIEEIQIALAPLLSNELISDEMLLKYGFITEKQKDSLHVPGWESAYGAAGTQVQGIAEWLGDQVTDVLETPSTTLGLPMEDIDLEYEQHHDRDLEGAEGQDDHDLDALQGTWVPFRRQMTGIAHAGLDDRKISKMLRFEARDSLYGIQHRNRGSVYRYFEKRLDRKILQDLKKLFKEYKELVDQYRVTKWHNNIKLIDHLGTKVIGCTTTGLSKYRGLIAAIRPRTLLIEEAAETLEGTVIAGMYDSLEHLILVGDHQQLQAHANVSALEQAPYNLSISMFERLVNNSVGFTMLNKQRRMIPEIRKLLCVPENPFYNNLQDHPSVLDRVNNRPPVPGMGNRDTYFFHHNWPEARNSDCSRYNIDEAEMIAGFFNYLVLNGTEPSKITVLTFYNGQRKTILKELKIHPTLGGNTYFNVFTVDSYQGEENDIILLSLVRSNEYLGIGFLDSKNRLVVALSRARRGLYVFGNAVTLVTGETTEDGIGREPLWNPLICYMKKQRQLNIDRGLPITCKNHGKLMEMKEADNFNVLAGGCDQKCNNFLSCGHACPYTCHPFDHDKIICAVSCSMVLDCGHNCSNLCGEMCECKHQACFVVENPMPSSWDEDLDLEARQRSATSSMGRSNRRQRHSPQKGGVAFTSSEVRNDRGRMMSDGYSYNQREYSPHPTRSFYQSNTSAPRPPFFSPNSASPAPSPGASQKWMAFDAKKSDMELDRKLREEEAAMPKVAPSELVFRETYLPTTTKSGVRVKFGEAVTRVVARAVEEDENLFGTDDVTDLFDRDFPTLSIGTKKNSEKEQLRRVAPAAAAESVEEDLISF